MRTLILSIACLGLIACGAKSPEEDNLQMIRISEDAHLSAFVGSVELDSKTPVGVGSLLTLNEGSGRNIGLCTWFLVGDQLAMTNSHCIPAAAKVDSTNCRKLVQGVFNTPNGPVTRSCKRLLKYSGQGDSVLTNNDYALIELDKKVDATHLEISRVGVQDNEKIKIFTMNHSGQNPIVAKYVQHNCVVRSSDIYGRWISESTSPLTAFKEELSNDYCKTVSGNSGAPVVNWNGKVIGVLHGGIDETAKSTLEGHLDEETTSNLGVFTNLRCLSLGLDQMDKDLPENCDEVSRDADAIRKIMASKLEERYTVVLRSLLSMQPAFLEYKVEAQHFGTKAYIYITPKCVLPMERWSAEDKSQIRKKGFIFVTKEIDARISQYEVNTTVSSDYYGNFSFDVVPNLRYTDWYQVTDLEDLGKGPIPLILQPGSGELTKLEMKIGQCN